MALYYRSFPNFVLHVQDAAGDSESSLAGGQWAPAAQGARRALNFDVEFAALPPGRAISFGKGLVKAMRAAFPVAEWTEVGRWNTSTVVRSRLEASFGNSTERGWEAEARRIYAMLRSGTCREALNASTWGLSSVQQVVQPYLKRSYDEGNGYVVGKVVHSLTVNLLLPERSMDWFSLSRAQAFVLPVAELDGTTATAVWRHAHVTENGTAGVIAALQTSSLSARRLGEINGLIRAGMGELWPAPVWGPVLMLPGAQIRMTAGKILGAAPCTHP
ncbi:hypothetical protein H632_c356p0, partial [Helicosporidium sp. ATCC 50920]